MVRLFFNSLICVLFGALWLAAATSVKAGPLLAAGGAAVGPSESRIHLVNNDPGKGAMDFVSDMGERAIGFLSSNMDTEQKKAAFSKLLQDSFDMKTIGRFSLGRYWRAATPEQRKEYDDLFERMVISVYSRRFSDYQGQKFVTRSYRNDGQTDTIVTSFIVPNNGPEVQVDWRIRNKNGQYKVIDVIVEGVSMSVTQRSDFSSVIQRGGGDVQVLLAHLRGQ